MGTRVGEPANLHAPLVFMGPRQGAHMIGVLIAILLAALAYALCVALGLPSIVAVVAAVLVLLTGVPSRGYGLRRRF